LDETFGRKITWFKTVRFLFMGSLKISV
jgi:hypothetical protein